MDLASSFSAQCTIMFNQCSHHFRRRNFFLLPLVRQTSRYRRRRNALDRINGICKSDSIFSFLNPLHNIFPFIDIIRHAYFFSNRKIHCLHFKSLCEQNKQKHMQAMCFRLPVYRLPLNIVFLCYCSVASLRILREVQKLFVAHGNLYLDLIPSANLNAAEQLAQYDSPAFQRS